VTGQAIAAVGIWRRPSAAILSALGLNKLRALERLSLCAAMNAKTGELITSNQKSGRIDGMASITAPQRQSNRAAGQGRVGVPCLHRDASRIAFTGQERREEGSAVAFLEAAIAYYAARIRCNAS